VIRIFVSVFLVVGSLQCATVALCADPDTSTLTCPQGLKLGIYDTPKEGTKPWRNKHIRCEQINIKCPPLMKPVYHDTQVFGSTPMDNGKFVRCEEISGPPN
jgi:hypothetical protein